MIQQEIPPHQVKMEISYLPLLEEMFTVMTLLEILQVNMKRGRYGNLPQCKTDNLHSIAKAGDTYTPHHAAWLAVHQHKCYPTSAHS
jgi:hypothetical protein